MDTPWIVQGLKLLEILEHSPYSPDISPYDSSPKWYSPEISPYDSSPNWRSHYEEFILAVGGQLPQNSAIAILLVEQFPSQ
ncbi:hypothetical protein TNCV_4056391 [Trichonephila clavipes]|nr:hypothetical protein TNCV_4056391 [Trichonephila clavipes]